MKKNTISKAVLVITLVALMGIGGTAFAYRQGGGSGWGQENCNGYGGQQGRGGQGYGRMMANLSEEDQAKINELRQKHFEATESLRSERDVKRFALRSELAKQNPDNQAALELQRELSALNADLGQKRIEHIIEMKKINPNAGRGFMMGAGDSRGKGGGHGYDRGCRKR